MGFDLGSAINSAADWVCSAPIVRGVVSNPVFTALLIVSLAAIVVMALYHYQVKRAGLKKGVRAFIYVFLIVLAVQFVHHYAVLRCARQAAVQKGVRDVFTSIEQSRSSGAPGAVPVVPMGYEQPVPRPLAAAPEVVTTGGAVTGGDCGCPQVEGGVRPDNVAIDADLVIEDVVIPSATSPFGATK